MEFQSKKLEPAELNQFIELLRVFEEVFETANFKMADQDYLKKLLDSDAFFVFVAIHEGQVIGGLTAYIMHQYYSPSTLVYIYDLAVKEVWQRKGVGRQLIQDTNQYCRKIGAEVVMVEAEESDDHAVKFYESTGGKKIKTCHFDYYLNEIGD